MAKDQIKPTDAPMMYGVKASNNSTVTMTGAGKMMHVEASDHTHVSMGDGHEAKQPRWSKRQFTWAMVAAVVSIALAILFFMLS